MQTYRKIGLLVCVFCIFILFFYSIDIPARKAIYSINSYFPRYQNTGTICNNEQSTESSTLSRETFHRNTSTNWNDPSDLHLPKQSTESSNSFRETFRHFPWDAFEDAAANNLTADTLAYSKLLIDRLVYFLKLEPLHPVNEQCKPPTLSSADEIDCTLYPNAFTGAKRSLAAKIGVLLQFGFDVDVLEIHLNELFGVVDKFFIIESTRAHYANLKKPLMWELVKRQERFKKFPVVHLIIDEADSLKVGKGTDWSMETLQERLRWLKFLEWNSAIKYFSDEDVIGFGDADEIPNRSRLNMFKYCEMHEDSVDFGIWFPFGHINQAFRSDFPVRSHPLTLGDPTFYELKSAKRLAENHPNVYPTRKRGHSVNYILGGIHMTHYGYLPFQMAKHVTATEGGLRTLKDLQKLSKYLRDGDIANMEVDLAATPVMHMPKIVPLNQSDPEMNAICILPWFYDCNRKRYPVWEDGHDTRLD